MPKGAKGFKRPLGCADANVKDQEGYTPLHMCTYRLVGGGGIWKALIECGADVDVKGGQWGAEPQHPYVYGFVRIVQWCARQPSPLRALDVPSSLHPAGKSVPPPRLSRWM